jgi:hypothetical protein
MTSTALPGLVDVVATRRTLHKLAEDVLAAEQYAANHELALHSLGDGFGTGWFPSANGPARIRVDGDQLVREGTLDEVREPITGAFDLEAARVLYAWWSLGASVLAMLEPGVGETISPVILWPEHFDVAVTVTTADARGLNLGFSPGDDFSAEPYVYAGPWEPLSGEFWNAPFGAYRTYEQVAVDGPAEVAADFLATARAAFAQR